MDKLKLILKKALAQGANQGTIRVGEQCKLIIPPALSVSLVEFGIADEAWIDGLYKALFPREGLAIRSEQLVRSQFSIVNVGTVFVIADPRSPKTLHLFFPPNGELLSKNFWISLVGSSKTNTASVPSTPPPPPPEAPRAREKIPTPPPDPLADAPTQVADAVGMGASTAAKAVKPESTTTRQKSTTLSATSHHEVEVPNVLGENKSKLALIVSSDQNLTAKTKPIVEKMELFAFPVEDYKLFFNILDRFYPKLIFLDENVANYQDILKKVYDLPTEKRAQTTVILLGKSARFNDTKAAFANSVDGIMNRGELEELEAYTHRIHSGRQTFFQSWLDLSSKV